MTPKRLVGYGLLAGITLLLFLLFSWGQLTRSREAAIRAADDLSACRHYAAKIQSLRELPAQAGIKEVGRSELDRQMEQAAQVAELPLSSIMSINPGSPQRLGTSVYQEKPTEVQLKNVTLEQLINFLYDLSTKSVGLEVKAVRLTAPREQDASGRWMAQATLSYLIYAPQKALSPARGEP